MTAAGAAPGLVATREGDVLFAAHRDDVFRRTDRLFAVLMAVQWVAAVAGGIWLTPRTWAGPDSSVHPHLVAAIVVGSLVSALPIWLALTSPGTALTRHVVAVGQMLMSALLIDVTGGRIETHFHVFGSLAFLAIYRDWRVLVSASAVVAVDHFVRGVWYPVSVYGVTNAGPFRWLEHAGWVVFEDVFLIAACRRSVREMREIAERTAELRRERDRFEDAVRERTAELAESESRFRSLSISAPVGIFETDASGGCTYTNPRWSEITGLDAAASRGDGWTAAVHPDDRDELLRTWREATRGSREWTREFRVRTPAGDMRWVHALARAMSGERGAGWVATVEDVTERRLAEDERTTLAEQLRQSQKMEAVGRLAGGIAHDFNNLLTAIVGFGELLKTRLGPGHPGAPSVEQILVAGERATGLTRQLLAFGRRQVLQVTVLDLREVVAGTVPMLERLIGEDVDLQTVQSADLGTVRADRGQVEQVLMNLVLNARDAMPTGGKLTIELVNVDLDEHYAATRIGVRPGRYVMLGVSDNGVGMDAETRSHLFEPFFTTKQQGRGTGLGLATVYGIVRQSQGHIGVYSEPGHGTTVKVFLPRVDVPTPAPVRRVDGEMPRGTETILLVEDEPGVRRLTESVLADLGYRVLPSAGGEEALRVAAAHEGTVDLVLTDIVMPGMGGRELVGRLGATRPGVRSIYMSGYTDDAIVRHGVLQREAEFLQKPFTPSCLALKVRSVLDRRSRSPAPVVV